MNLKQLEQIERVCQQWLFVPQDLPSLEQTYQGLCEIDFSSVVKAFTGRLSEIDYHFTKSEQVSGAICFYGSVFVSLLNTGKIEQIEHLFTFALCYMLVDHFLDDNTNTEVDKKMIMEDLERFISGEPVENRLIAAAKTRYSAMTKSCPEVQKEIKDLFQAEWRGHEISKSQLLSREDYREIAWKKGAGTARTIACIIGLDPETNSHLGALIQLVDDCLDVSDDQKLDIYTLARFDLETSNWDKYIWETVVEIEKLSNTYNFFKPILLMGLVLGFHDHPGCVSPELAKILQGYDVFGNRSKDNLNEWFHEKIFDYVSESSL